MSNKKLDLSEKLSSGTLTSLRSKFMLLAALSWPAMMAQMSTILMEYIDASMVGSLGAVPSASIGLIATSTWLMWGIGTATVTGFSVQVAHRIGAMDNSGARQVLRKAIKAVFLISLVVMATGLLISQQLPHWLGGKGEVCSLSADYFLIFSSSIPCMFMTFLASSMLRCSGNMVIPGVANVLMCILDVVFNFALIFPCREVTLLGNEITIPGMGLGVAGAALGSFMSTGCCGIWMWIYLMFHSRRLKHPYSNKHTQDKPTLHTGIYRKAVSISWPVALERFVMCGAQILITSIVAPLGNAAIAANAFAVTAESLCYMPGYGVSEAATTLVGQSLGAGQNKLAISFGRLSLFTGMTIMGILGVVMWFFSPEMMRLFTTDAEIISQGVIALRTEAWAEPMFGASIVAYGVFIGAGYTLTPALINFSSIWAVRLTLSAILAPVYGLFGVWLAMCIELCVRGLAFLVVFFRYRWTKFFKSPPADAQKEIMEEPPRVFEP